MRVIKQVKTDDFLIGSVVAVGNFDGIHIGHQAVLTELYNIAQTLNVPSVVVLFNPHPKNFFAPQQPVLQITLINQQIELIKNHLIDCVYQIEFNEAIANLGAEDFVKGTLLDKLNMKAIVLGEDFCFGKNRQGNTIFLKQLASQLHFDVVPVNNVCVKNERVSSSLVRSCLQQGNMMEAKMLLGSCYQIRGQVIKGTNVGMMMSIPTANINISNIKVPIKGVFAVTIDLENNKYYGIANIGSRPTFGLTQCLLEIHIINFSQNIYDKYLTVNFEHKIRDEIKFNDINALIKQIFQDIIVVKDFFSI